MLLGARIANLPPYVVVFQYFCENFLFLFCADFPDFLLSKLPARRPRTHLDCSGRSSVRIPRYKPTQLDSAFLYILVAWSRRSVYLSGPAVPGHLRHEPCGSSLFILQHTVGKPCAIFEGAVLLQRLSTFAAFVKETWGFFIIF